MLGIYTSWRNVIQKEDWNVVMLQGSDTQVIPKKCPLGSFRYYPLKKPSKKPAPNLIRLLFVVPVIIKDFVMYTSSNNQ